jgi:hypothetical protein
MIRDCLRAALIVLAFLFILAEVREHDEASFTQQQFSTTEESK